MIKPWVGLCVSLALGCHEGGHEEICVAQDEIVGGQSEVLDTLGAAASSIGRLETADGSVRCSGTVVAPNWVVTAKHCASELTPISSFSVGGGEGLRRVPTSLSVAHPERDVMLVRLFDASPLGFEPLPTPVAEIDSDWVGRSVVLAGYGDDAQGQRGALAAVSASIVSIDSGSIEVDGDGARGACEGDSGGPLLWADDSGRVFTMGVLRSGSTSCQGRDRYDRVDALAEWSLAAMAAADADPCAGVSQAGSCEHHVPHYCKNGLPIFEQCPPGLGCGWDAEVSGARCVAPESDACDGAIAGRCDGNDLLTCNHGKVSRKACGVCARCIRTTMGGARCE